MNARRFAICVSFLVRMINHTTHSKDGIFPGDAKQPRRLVAVEPFWPPTHLFSVVAMVLILVNGGCVIPLGSRLTAGQEFSKETIAFLDLPGTTRNEVIATLGLPIVDSQETRMLVYVKEKTQRYAVTTPEEVQIGEVQIPLGGREIEFNGPSTSWALLIAYDERGIVCAHEVRKMELRSLETQSSKWRQKLKVEN